MRGSQVFSGETIEGIADLLGQRRYSHRVTRDIGIALRVVSVPVGVVVGLSAASVDHLRCNGVSSCAAGQEILPTFMAWECALFGAIAAALLIVASIVLGRRVPN